MKKIGIIGSGVVAQTLAKGFVTHGYQVMIDSRSPDKLADLRSQSDDMIPIFLNPHRAN
jgi:saccharopine dehydrogenase-like NADP-dependent oxidoreductase